MLIGTKEYCFETSTEFTLWKETIEEETHTYYTKEKEYKPADGRRFISHSIIDINIIMPM